MEHTLFNKFMRKIFIILTLLFLIVVISGCSNEKSEVKLDSRCYEEGTSEGDCDAVFLGYKFDGEKCVEDSVGGCSGSMPFETLEECQNKCLK